MNHFGEEHAGSISIDELFKQFTKDNFSDSKQQDPNNSFLFLEKGSLNLLLAYLLSKPQAPSPKAPNITDELASKEEAWAVKAVEQLEQFIHDSDQEFQDILHLLKEMT